MYKVSDDLKLIENQLSRGRCRSNPSNNVLSRHISVGIQLPSIRQLNTNAIRVK